jgi:hypothetical protein
VDWGNAIFFFGGGGFSEEGVVIAYRGNHGVDFSPAQSLDFSFL